MKKWLKISVVFVLEIILFVSAYFNGVFQQTLFATVGNNISALPLFPQLRSLLLLLWFTLPIVTILYLINFTWPKLSGKIFLFVHLAFIIFAFVTLELLVLLI